MALPVSRKNLLAPQTYLQGVNSNGPQRGAMMAVSGLLTQALEFREVPFLLCPCSVSGFGLPVFALLLLLIFC